MKAAATRERSAVQLLRELAKARLDPLVLRERGAGKLLAILPLHLARVAIRDDRGSRKPDRVEGGREEHARHVLLSERCAPRGVRVNTTPLMTPDGRPTPR